MHHREDRCPNRDGHTSADQCRQEMRMLRRQSPHIIDVSKKSVLADHFYCPGDGEGLPVNSFYN
jgi:hypothetical protein